MVRMASSVEESIMSQREEIADDGEPLRTVTRSITDRGESLGHTIPALAVELLDIDDTDEVEIDIYQDGYVVRQR